MPLKNFTRKFKSLVQTLRDNIRSVAGSGSKTKRTIERLFNRLEDSEKMKMHIDSAYPDYIKTLSSADMVVEVDQMTETSSRMRKEIDRLCKIIVL